MRMPPTHIQPGGYGWSQQQLTTLAPTHPPTHSHLLSEHRHTHKQHSGKQHPRPSPLAPLAASAAAPKHASGATICRGRSGRPPPLPSLTTSAPASTLPLIICLLCPPLIVPLQHAPAAALVAIKGLRHTQAGRQAGWGGHLWHALRIDMPVGLAWSGTNQVLDIKNVIRAVKLRHRPVAAEISGVDP